MSTPTSAPAPHGVAAHDATAPGAGGAAAAPAAPPARPRSGLRTALLWGGGILAGVIAINGGLQLLSVVSAQEDSWTTTFEVSSDLEVKTRGSITVVVDPAATKVTVKSVDKWSFNKPAFDAAADGDSLRLTSSCSGWSSWIGSERCAGNLTVTVPEDTDMTLHSSSANVTATGVNGAVVASTGSGTVRINDVSGAVTAKVLSGNIWIAGVGGAVDAHTGSGSVQVDDSSAAVKANSSSGRVTVNKTGGDVNASSGSGTVEVTDVRGDVSARASSGRVKVADVTGSATAHSGSGSVTVRNAAKNIEATASSGNVTVYAPKGAKAVNLSIRSSSGRTTIEAPTDPAATTSVTIRSGSGSVKYLPAEADGTN